MPTRTTENYLKAIFFLQQENQSISLSDLSRAMNLSTPTVNSMVKKLKENNYVLYEKYKPIQLTEEGKKTAALVIRKHRLTEMYLVEKMQFGWEEVHDIAEQIEHINSPKFFERMDELLGYPSIDPHGSPIPNKHGEVAYPSYNSLAEMNLNQKVELVALTNSSSDFLRYLNRLSFELGSVLEVKYIESFDQSMTVYFQGQDIILSKDICERMLVKPI